MNNIYYNPTHTAAFSSIKKIKEAKPENSVNKIKKWLQNQDTYTLHKPVVKKFKRNKYHVTNIDDLFEADLIDLKSLSKFNNDIKYLLTVIDVFSKYAWVRKLKTKCSKDVAAAFEDIFKSSNRIPINLQSDKGGEFLGPETKKCFKKHGINHIQTENPDIKASVIERFNRTLKEKMFKYFTHKNSYEYVNILQTLVDTYNKTKHSTIKMAPIEVNENNILEIYNKAYRVRNRNPNKNKFKVNDYVRISKYKHVFEKGYESNWTMEIFKVVKIIKRHPHTVYKLCDLQNEAVEGIFYEPELQKVTYSEDSAFKIDKILRKRLHRGIREVYVKWRGYPDKFNSWIPQENITLQ